MTIPFIQEGLPLPVGEPLLALLSQALHKQDINLAEHQHIVFNFLNLNYHPIKGGYHPVEIRIARQEAGWQIETIRDLCYAGYHEMCGLEPELAFDFANLRFEHIYLGELEHEEASDLYRLWERNFCVYHAMGAYQLTLQLDASYVSTH